MMSTTAEASSSYQNRSAGTVMTDQLLGRWIKTAHALLSLQHLKVSQDLGRRWRGSPPQAACKSIRAC